MARTVSTTANNSAVFLFVCVQCTRTRVGITNGTTIRDSFVASNNWKKTDSCSAWKPIKAHSNQIELSFSINSPMSFLYLLTFSQKAVEIVGIIREIPSIEGLDAIRSINCSLTKNKYLGGFQKTVKIFILKLLFSSSVFKSFLWNAQGLHLHVSVDWQHLELKIICRRRPFLDTYLRIK